MSKYWIRVLFLLVSYFYRIVDIVTPKSVNITTLNSQYCVTDPDVVLQAQPMGNSIASNNFPGGTFPGGNIFSPLNAGPGTHIIDYVLTNSVCNEQTSKEVVKKMENVFMNQVTVLPLPTPTLNVPRYICPDTPFIDLQDYALPTGKISA